jgi:hypothetical protein
MLAIPLAIAAKDHPTAKISAVSAAFGPLYLPGRILFEQDAWTYERSPHVASASAL